MNKGAEDALMLVIGGPKKGSPGMEMGSEGTGEEEEEGEEAQYAALLRRVEELEAQVGIK